MDNPPDLYTEEQRRALVAARDLARTCGYEAVHTGHVTRLALRLFDELKPLHMLGDTERFYLGCASMLHDIGWVEGWRGHHKTALKIILRTTLLPLDNRERLIIGSVARYHTKALPNAKHDHFAALDPADRHIVVLLSAILRLADGLDRSHRSVVRDVKTKITDTKITLYYGAPTRAKLEEEGAKENSDLLTQVFERKLSIRWEPI